MIAKTFFPLLVFLLACRPLPAPVPPDAETADAGNAGGGDASPRDLAREACSNLRAFGCIEGEPPCEEIFRDAERTHIINLRSTCVAKSVDPRQCGRAITCTRRDGG